MDIRIGVIGLGYVGLPLALAFANKFRGTVGFDLNPEKIASIQKGIDPNGEGSDEELRSTSLSVSSDLTVLENSNLLVVAVPTPVDEFNNPDFSPLISACETVGKVLRKGTIVVFESTVYPGVTEDICGPIIEKVSNLKRGVDFKLGYSPERMNPGDREHTVDRIVKVVSGEDAETLRTVSYAYGQVISAGVHEASSIMVAEAAKVIENTQRDLNIALMNELAMIFDRMNISTREVLDAAGTKWNFLRFSPGLVGGHCIGVDPYYLTAKATQLGYHPQVILAGRRVNDGMGAFIAQRAVKLMANSCLQIKGARIGILGLTFKENVSDIRNSRVPDIVHELEQFGAAPLVHDPYASKAATKHEYGIDLRDWDELKNLDGVVLAVAHNHYKEMAPADLLARVKDKGIVVDVKAVLSKRDVPPRLNYWCL